MTEVYQYKPGDTFPVKPPFAPSDSLKVLARQIGGSHYKTGIQPWEYIEANNLDFFEGNVIKYVTRKKGNRLEDLEKAKHYIDYLIEREKDGKLSKTP